MYGISSSFIRGKVKGREFYLLIWPGLRKIHWRISLFPALASSYSSLMLRVHFSPKVLHARPYRHRKKKNLRKKTVATAAVLTSQSFHSNPKLESSTCYVSEARARSWAGQNMTHSVTVEKQVEQCLCLRLGMLFNPQLRADSWIFCYTRVVQKYINTHFFHPS